jgi:hypothetical protein
MAYNLLIKPIVFFDVEEAYNYYNEKSPGLGSRFYNQFLSAIKRIENNPFSYLIIKEPVRRCKIKMFPYKVFYTITGESIFVIGVSHAKRSNAFIKKRLGRF